MKKIQRIFRLREKISIKFRDGYSGTDENFFKWNDYDYEFEHEIPNNRYYFSSIQKLSEDGWTVIQVIESVIEDECAFFTVLAEQEQPESYEAEHEYMQVCRDLQNVYGKIGDKERTLLNSIGQRLYISPERMKEIEDMIE